MIGRIVASLVTFYETRGKDELKSFFTSLLAGFIASMLWFCGECVGLLWDPSVPVKDVSYQIYDAAMRSLIAALLYALMPKVFPIRKSK